MVVKITDDSITIDDSKTNDSNNEKIYCAFCNVTGDDPYSNNLSNNFFGTKPCRVCHGERFKIVPQGKKAIGCQKCGRTGKGDRHMLHGDYDPCKTCGGWGQL
jgi:hypothetical protein